MLELAYDYGLFLAKTLTIVLALAGFVILVVMLMHRTKETRPDHLEIKKLNEKFDEIAESMKHATATKAEAKKFEKERKAREKAEKKAEESAGRKRIFVLNFDGDIKASAVSSLREEITAILTIAETKDEVFLRLNSPGGVVHGYGLAASQLQRIRDREIRLVAAVDKVAASGGYMMACVANHIMSAPFAVLGSIGVVAQIPNFHRLLKKHDIDYEMVTAGEYKRTLTMFGENTDVGRAKFKEDLEDIHGLFKDFVSQHRPQVDIGKVSTGEHWFGKRALDLSLVDEIRTSDDYLLSMSREADLYEVTYAAKKGLSAKVSHFFQKLSDSLIDGWSRRDQESRLP